ncbi:hypothetical protein FLAV_02626 [Flavobacteriales bacterium]|nr:hypothetical protein [Candidatus Methanoperedens sp.]CAG0996404.1 hypothetical protein FLAV_02626 [Flavobacteriales bacterium]
MAELFTREQARAWLRANNLKTGKSIQDAFINEIKFGKIELDIPRDADSGHEP